MDELSLYNQDMKESICMVYSLNKNQGMEVREDEKIVVVGARQMPKDG